MLIIQKIYIIILFNNKKIFVKIIWHKLNSIKFSLYFQSNDDINNT